MVCLEKFTRKNNNYWFSIQDSSLEVKYLCHCFKFGIKYLMQFFNKFLIKKTRVSDLKWFMFDNVVLTSYLIK